MLRGIRNVRLSAGKQEAAEQSIVPGDARKARAPRTGETTYFVLPGPMVITPGKIRLPPASAVSARTL